MKGLYPAKGNIIAGNKIAAIDFSNKNEGYIWATYFGQEDKKCKVRVTHLNSSQGFYFAVFRNQPVVLPLTYGNGNYRVEVFQQLNGTTYNNVLSQTFDVALRDKLLPNLYPNTYVNYNANSKCVAKAAEICRGFSLDKDRSKAIYKWIESNIKYNKAKASELNKADSHWFVPNPDDVLAKGSGICFDYASLLAAMNRSQGIPCRIAIGLLRNTGKHAWNELYWENEGYLNTVFKIPAKVFTLVDVTLDVSYSDTQAANWFRDLRNYTTEYRG